MEKRTIVALGVAGALFGGVCLMTGVVGGVLLARGLPHPASSPAPPGPGPAASPDAPAPASSPDVQPPAPSPSPGSAPAASPAAAEPWETRQDPTGFAVSVPRSWKVEGDCGKVRITGPRGEQVLVWPFFVAAALDQDGARALLGTFAERQSRVKWGGSETPRPNVVRQVGMSGPGLGAWALLTWAVGPEGTAGQASLALPGEGPIDAGVAARILASFRCTGAPAGAGPARSALEWVRWRDPLEGAFTVEVPKGWRVEGGLKRFAPTDPRGQIVVTSPDGLVRASAGDWEIPTFTEPTRLGVQLGFTEGKWYAPAGTQQFLIRRYLTGLEVGRDYVQRKIGSSVAGLEIAKERERTDLAAPFVEEMRRAAVPGQSGRATAGEIAFQGRLGERPAVGVYFCGTRVSTLQSPGIDPISIWGVVILNGWVAVKEKAGVGASVLDRLVRSFEYTPEWVRMQQGITLESARIVHDTNEDISKKISDTYWGRAASETELSRRRSNANLGVEDVTDPGSGKSWKVESGSSYYWLDDRGNIVGTNTPAAPTSDYRELIREP